MKKYNLGMSLPVDLIYRFKSDLYDCRDQVLKNIDETFKTVLKIALLQKNFYMKIAVLIFYRLFTECVLQSFGKGVPIVDFLVGETDKIIQHNFEIFKTKDFNTTLVTLQYIIK